jgi:hypothetical protein
MMVFGRLVVVRLCGSCVDIDTRKGGEREREGEGNLELRPLKKQS